MAPARRGHFFRKLVSGAKLSRIYAERASAAQPAETDPRLFPAARRASLLRVICARSQSSRVPFSSLLLRPRAEYCAGRQFVLHRPGQNSENRHFEVMNPY